MHISHQLLPKRISTNAAIVMDHFGLDLETGRHVIADDLELPIEPGQIVLFVGPSGSGKSSLLRAAQDELCDPPIVNLDELELGERLVIDALDLEAGDAMKLLSQCGLSEAQLMLRTPAELSEGQRYRFRLAMAIAELPNWIVADEFTATLDRPLAKIIAYNLRRFVFREPDPPGFLLATTHDDIIDDLQPDLLVRCGTVDGIQVERRTPVKKRSPSRADCGSARGPSPTGRISLGGITGRRNSVRSAS